MARYKFSSGSEWKIFCGRKTGPKWLDNFIILVDTRESDAWEFPSYQSRREKLMCGDYSISIPATLQKKEQKLDTLIAIERKANIQDLIACMTSERKRFVAELEQLRLRKYALVICEFSQEDFLRDAVATMQPKAAWHTIVSWSAEYCPFLFCPTREMAKDAFLYVARKAVKLFGRA